MKGVILAAGAGSRLRPLTHTAPKALLPIANRPVLDYALSALAAAGVGEAAVVMSPEQAGWARQLSGRRCGVDVTVLYQEKPRGVADAVYVARDFVGTDPFCVYLGDNLTGASLATAVQQFAETGGAAGLLLVKAVANPSQFGVAVVENGQVRSVVEKPQAPPSPLAITGIYLFTPEVFGVIPGLAPSARGELEITDAIAAMVAAGRPVLARSLDSWWCDVGTPAGMLAANREILDSLVPAGGVDDGTAKVVGSEMQGRVQLGPGAVVEDSLVRGPVVIGADTCIKGSYVGPYTSIGAECRVENSAVENSILMARAAALHLPHRLTESILGQRARVGRTRQLPAPEARLVVGDDGQLELPGGG